MHMGPDANMLRGDTMKKKNEIEIKWFFRVTDTPYSPLNLDKCGLNDLFKESMI